MKLTSLKKYDDIVIQIHNDPDADAVGSGYALYQYFSSCGKSVRLVYGGRSRITKSNILILIDALKIPVEYINEPGFFLAVPELLLTVDCQYGEGNVQHIKAEKIAWCAPMFTICSRRKALTSTKTYPSPRRCITGCLWTATSFPR